MIYEICASSFESARNAQLAGANRIELCSELGIGGVTPSYGLIQKVMEELTIQNCVLIRPRSGNFTYTDAEFDVMIRDIKFCRSIHCQGVVTGVLHSNNTIDIERTQRLIEAAGDIDFIYHRAFDCVPNPEEALDVLMKLGVKRILTSGQKKSAIEGLELLKTLNQQAGEKLTIMPGGGINSNTILKIKESGFKEVHFSGTVFEKTGSELPFSFNTAAFLDESVRPISSIENIRKIIDSL